MNKKSVKGMVGVISSPPGVQRDLRIIHLDSALTRRNKSDPKSAMRSG